MYLRIRKLGSTVINFSIALRCINIIEEGADP